MEDLGDRVKEALSSVGVTEEAVSGWLGAPCNCKGRIDRLNKLGAWASSVMSGSIKNAKELLDNLFKT